MTDLWEKKKLTTCDRTSTWQFISTSWTFWQGGVFCFSLLFFILFFYFFFVLFCFLIVVLADMSPKNGNGKMLNTILTVIK